MTKPDVTTSGGRYVPKKPIPEIDWTDLSAACRRLGFESADAEKIIATEVDLTDEENSYYCGIMTDPDKQEEGYKELEARLAPDPDGLKILKVLLGYLPVSRELYRAKRIGEEVFTDTMKCFSRFTYECKKNIGRLCFDRAFWVGKQLSLIIFRLGALEYEYKVIVKNAKIPSNLNILNNGAGAYIGKTPSADPYECAIHVPSDADLSPLSVDKSFVLYESFTSEFYPIFIGSVVTLHSWLLSSSLKKILPPDSNIIRFQSRFRMVSEVDDDSFRYWVYGSNDIPDADLPENTTLQRGIKAYLLSGRKVFTALGVLKSHMFPIF